MLRVNDLQTDGQTDTVNYRNNFAVQNIHNKKEVKHFEKNNENERARTAWEKKKKNGLKVKV